MDQLELTDFYIFSDHNAVRLDINYREKKKQLLKIQTCGG